MGTASTQGTNTFNGLTASVTVTGSGAGVLNQFQGNPGAFFEDQFQFINRPFTGDFEISFRIPNVSSLPALAQVGVAIREDLSPSPRGISLTYAPQVTNTSPPHGVIQYICRTLATGWLPPGTQNWSRSVNAQPNPEPNPLWFKISRVGGDVGVYWGRDGSIWIPCVNGAAFVLPGICYAGFFVTSNDQSTLVTQQFDNIYIGVPRLNGVISSWVGNTYSQASKSNLSRQIDDGFVSTYIQNLWVDLDGTCWTGSSYDESGDANKIYSTNGKIIRTLTDNGTFGNNPCVEGGTVGNTSYTYVWVGVVGSKKIARVDKAGNWVNNLTITNTIGANVTGMALSNTATHELYVSDVANNRILVFDTSTNAELPGRAFTFTQGRPGPIAVDTRGDLWIIQEGWTSPLFHQTAPTLATGVYKYSKLGVDSGKHILDMIMPTSVCIDPNNDLLYCTENGPDQNIRVYGNLSTTPALHHTFGQQYGIYSGGTPGAIYDANFGGYARFYGLVGVGVDSQGSVYVACNRSGSDLRKFDSHGSFVWALHGSEDGFGCPDFDPGTDGRDMYTLRMHYGLDLNQTTPGGEWSYKSFTQNPLLHPTDPRADQSGQPIIRRINGQKFMFVTMGGLPTEISIFRFDDQGLGETAIYCGAIRTIFSASPPGTTQLWLDLNGDGVEQAITETTSIPSPQGGNGSVPIMAYDVGQNGDVYWLLGGFIVHLVCQGIGATGYPIYSLSTGYSIDPYHAPFTVKYGASASAYRIIYDSINDCMYLSGNTTTKSNSFSGACIARYDNWSVTHASNPQPRWVITLPTLATDNNWYTQPFWTGNDPTIFAFKSVHASGNYVFAFEEFGQIHVYDALTGNAFTRIAPGPEVDALIAFTDPISSRSYCTSTGEYLITMESSGFKAKNPLYRWTPNRKTSTWPGVCTSLVAISDNGKINLSWSGPGGVVDSYRVYRRVDWQAETIVVYDLHQANYVDTTAPIGSLCSYRVTAINPMGEGAKSTEAFATNLTATASFVKLDTTSQGTWKPLYGQRGNYIVGDSNNLGTGVVFSVFTNIQTIFASGSTDPRALQLPAHASTTRELARWYNQVSFPTSVFGNVVMDLNVVDGASRVLAVYFVAYNSPSSQQRVEIRDGVSNALLDTQTLTSFDQGKWLVWNVTGHITINVIPLGGAIGEVNGVFLG